MSKKNRSIAGFDSVASNSNMNNNNTSDDNNVLDNIINNKKPKSKTHVFKGYYLENEVANTIDKVTTGKQKGVKSDLVNEILKKYFKSEGLL